MRRSTPRKVSVLAVGALARAVPACTQKGDEPGAETAAAIPGSLDPAAAPPSTGPGDAALGPRPPLLATVLPHDKGVVFGHFLVPDGSTLLREAKAQLTLPPYQGFLDEAALRSLVSLQLPEPRKGLAQNIDLAVPFGCALLDFRAYPKVPLACTFGYKGGASQLVTDLGPADKQRDAAAHLARYRFEDADVFVDELGGHVVLSAHDDAFGKTRAYLQDNLIARARQVRGDLEVVGYVADAFEHYRAEIEPFLREYRQSQVEPPAPASDPALGALASVWAEYNKRSTERTIQSFSEMAQLAFYLGVEPGGVVAGLSLVPTPGSRFEDTIRRSAGLRVDPGLAGSAPPGTFLLASYAARPDGFDDAAALEVRKLAAESWAALTREPAATAERALAELSAHYRDRYAGHSTLAFVHVDTAPLPGVLLAADLQAGKSARDTFRAFAQRCTPTALLGRELAHYVTWTFEVAPVEVDGVPVDRFTLEPSAHAKTLLERQLTEKDRQQIEQFFGGLRLTIHRAELGGRVLWTLAPRAEEAFLRQAIAASQGGASLAADPGLSRLLVHDVEPATLLGLDVSRTLAWMRTLPGIGPELASVPAGIGRDLADVFVTSQNRPDGVFAGELVVSQGLIDQAKQAIAQRGRP